MRRRFPIPPGSISEDGGPMASDEEQDGDTQYAHDFGTHVENILQGGRAQDERGASVEDLSTAVTTFSISSHLQAKRDVRENVQVANKLRSLRDTEAAIQRYEAPPDERRRGWIRAGHEIPQAEAQQDAPTLRIGLAFLAGADKPQVNFEERKMLETTPEVNQMNARWRYNTARALLSDFDV